MSNSEYLILGIIIGFVINPIINIFKFIFSMFTAEINEGTTEVIKPCPKCSNTTEFSDLIPNDRLCNRCGAFSEK